jgi:hypothetical protein
MEKLYFNIGSYFGKSFKIELFNDKIIFSENVGKFTKAQKVFDLDKHRIDNFIKSLDIINVWAWRGNYINAGISGGTQWEFEVVCKNGCQIKAIGSNKYPDSDEPSPSQAFLSLISSLEILIDSKNIISFN